MSPRKKWLFDDVIDVPRSTAARRKKALTTARTEALSEATVNRKHDDRATVSADLCEDVLLNREGNDSNESVLEETWENCEDEVPMDVVETLGSTYTEDDQDHQNHQLPFEGVEREIERPETNVTAKQAEYLIMAFVLRHSISGQGLTDLLDLLSVLNPGSNVSQSKFIFMKQFQAEASSSIHYICDVCGAYIGLDYNKCPSCNINVAGKDLKKLGSFFISASLETQLKGVVKRCTKEQFQCCEHDDAVMEDFCCGLMSQKLKRRHDCCLTLTWNTDGVPVSRSSKKSVWPVFCSVNELKFKERSSNMMLCGLWSGTKKPDMQIFLKPFIAELQKLGTEGLSVNLQNGEKLTVLVFSAAISVDTPARAMLQNMSQFNGKFGCGFCEKEGERVPRGGGTTRVYCESIETVSARTHQSFLCHSAAATPGHPVMGIKGTSILMQIPQISMSDSFVVDYMHAALLGVTRQFTTLWLENSDHRFSLKKRQPSINLMLLQIRPPKEIRRLSRSLDDRKFWKASEWRSFLLFYSPVVLRGQFPNSNYFNHWMLLVTGVMLLIQHRVLREDIEKAHCCFMKFIILIPRLYSEEHVSYNVHLLSHIKNTVVNWGPLWCSSAFSFEDANGRIKDLFHGTQAVPQQMVKNFLLLRQIGNANDVFDNAPLSSTNLFSKLTRSQAASSGSGTLHSGLVLLGKSSLGLSYIDAALLNEYLESVGEKLTETYERFIYKDLFFASHSYCKRFGRDDSYVSLFEGGSLLYGQIEHLVVVKDDLNNKPRAFLFFNVITVDHKQTIFDQFVGMDLYSKHKQIVSESSIPRVCSISCLRRKCIRVGNVLCQLPKFELD